MNTFEIYNSTFSSEDLEHIDFSNNREHLVSMLDKVDAEYAEMYNVLDSQWEISIETDLEWQILHIVYNRKGHFLRLNLVHCGGLEAEVSASINATLAAAQFNHIYYHRGVNRFPASMFTFRKRNQEGE